MPSFRWLEHDRVDVKLAERKLALMQKLGVPYTNAQIESASADQRTQADVVVADLAEQQVTVAWDSEIVALIAYLQRLGRDVGIKPAALEPARLSAVIPPRAPAAAAPAPSPIDPAGASAGGR
jgi:cytochrome c oxidase cbb3-type subunit I/II